MDSESIDPIIVTSEDAENALMLFPAEEAPDSSRSLIEREHHPPIAANIFGAFWPRPYRPPFMSRFKNWSSVRAQWLFEGAAPSKRVWLSAALVSAAALALLALTLGRDPSNSVAASRSTDPAAGTTPPVMNPPRTPTPATDAPPSLVEDVWAAFSRLSASAPSAPSTETAPSPRSRPLEIEPPRPAPDYSRTTENPVAEILVAPALPTSTEASTDPPPASMPGTSLSAERAAASEGPPAVTSDTSAIQDVLGRYLNAFMNLDVEEAKAVWPRVNERALSRAFASLDEQQFEMSECEIAVTGPSADASCTGVVRYVQKVGSKIMRVEPRRWKFALRNSDSQWFIENVDSR